MTVNELKHKLYDLFVLLEGTHGLDFLKSAFHDAQRGDIAIAVIELCMEGKLVISPAGISLPSRNVEASETIATDDAAPAESRVEQCPVEHVEVESRVLTKDSTETGEEECSRSADADPLKCRAEFEAAADTATNQDYLPEEEIEALIAKLQSSPNHPKFATGAAEADVDLANNCRTEDDESNILSDPEDSEQNDSNAAHEAQCDKPVFWTDSIDVLRLSTRSQNALHTTGIYTLRDLIANLGSIDSIDGMGEGSLKEIRHALECAALPFDDVLSYDQCLALRSVVNSDRFLVDMLGVVRIAPQISEMLLAEDSRTGAIVEDGLGLSGIESLSLPVKYERRLKTAGISTVGEIIAAGKRGLMDIRNAGMQFVETVCGAVDAFYESHSQSAPQWHAPHFRKLSHADFLKQFDSGVSIALYSARAQCERRHYALVSDAFDILLAPLAKRCLDAGKTLEETAEELVNVLEQMLELRDRCKMTLIEWCEQALSSGDEHAEVNVPEGELWHELAKSLDDARFDFEENRRVIHVRLLLASEWAQSQEGFPFDLLGMRLQGSTLQELGDNYSITRERVRQLTEKALSTRPRLAEDAWQQFFDAYNMDEGQFCSVTGLPAESYAYLCMTSTTRKSNRKNLLLALEDENVPQDVKSRLAYKCEGTSMDSDTSKALAVLLAEVQDFCAAEDIERKLRLQSPSFGNGTISTADVKLFGFETSGALIVRSSCDLHALFANLISKNGRFSLGLGEFPPAICSNEVFMSELSKAQRAFIVIEVNKGRFFSIREFEALSDPLRSEDFRSFLERTIDEAEPDVPFNAFTLGSQGKLGGLLAAGQTLGIGDYFVDAVLAQGYADGRIKCMSMADTPLYCKTDGQFTSTELLKEIIEPNNRMKVLDIQKVLASKYNVRLIPAQIRSIATRGGLRVSNPGDSIIVNNE